MGVKPIDLQINMQSILQTSSQESNKIHQTTREYSNIQQKLIHESQILKEHVNQTPETSYMNKSSNSNIEKKHNKYNSNKAKITKNKLEKKLEEATITDEIETNNNDSFTFYA